MTRPEAAVRAEAAPADAAAPRRPDPIVLGLFLLGAGLRLALCWRNPPANSFDAHFELVELMLQDGAVPDKLACYQCYHPPVSYVISFVVARLAIALGAGPDGWMKAVQLLNCAYAVGTLWLVQLVLARLPISRFAQLTAFAMIALLPRDIYMSAMYSNDAPSYFFMTASAYLVLRILEGGARYPVYVALAIATSAAIFTKYTALALLPMIAAGLGIIVVKRRRDRRAAVACAIALLVPVAVLGTAMLSNAHRYGSALPINTSIYDPTDHQPREGRGGADFVSFEPWRFVRSPLIRPGQVDKFWTLLEAGMWFDTEPRFGIFFGERSGWVRYYAWIRGEGPFPGAPPPRAYLVVGSALEVLGLVWLALGVRGAYRLVAGALRSAGPLREAALRVLPLIVLLAFNVAGVAHLVRRMPVLSTMKPSYLLGSMAAFAVLAAFGADDLAEWPRLRGLILAASFAFGGLVVLHVLQCAWAANAAVLG